MNITKQRAIVGWCPACRQQVTHRVVTDTRGHAAIRSFCGCEPEPPARAEGRAARLDQAFLEYRAAMQRVFAIAQQAQAGKQEVE